MKPLPWAAKWALRQALGKERGEKFIALIEAVNAKDPVLVMVALDALGVKL